jgi:hypothetical protein
MKSETKQHTTIKIIAYVCLIKNMRSVNTLTCVLLRYIEARLHVHSSSWKSEQSFVSLHRFQRAADKNQRPPLTAV